MSKVLITGGSRGIGAACVKAFANQGDQVAFFYRNSKEAAEALAKQTGAIAVCTDVSNPCAVEAGVKKVLEMLGGLDILVNNAGIARESLFTDLTDDDWRNMMSNNLDSVFYVTRAVLPAMIHEHHGSIVNIGSMWGKVGASCEAHYAAAKAGIRGLTLSLAKELGPSHVTVNCIEPGVIDTDMNRCYSAETMRELAEQTPLCRLGSAEDVANAVLFFSSEKASFITGQCIGVDGGFAI